MLFLVIELAASSHFRSTDSLGWFELSGLDKGKWAISSSFVELISHPDSSKPTLSTVVFIPGLAAER